MKPWKPKQSKPVYKRPKSVQRSIPIKDVFPGGIFMHNGEFSMMGSFTDINYQAAAPDEKRFLFAGYQELLKAFDIDELLKVTLVNRKVKGAAFESELYLPMKKDGFNEYREEINTMNRRRATEGTNHITQEKYVTVTTHRRKAEDAQPWFTRMESTLRSAFGKIGSRYERLETLERLKFFHDFFRPGEEEQFRLEEELLHKRGHTIRDYIAPDGMEFRDNYFKIGERYGRVLFLGEYPADLQDTLIMELMNLPKEMMLSIDMISKSKEDSLQKVQRKLLSVETEIANSTKKANEQGNYNATVPLRLDEKRSGLTDIIKLIKEYDQRIVWAQVTLLHMADSLKELDNDTETLISIGQQKMCRFQTAMYRQEQGLNTVLPYGLWYMDSLRTLTTENVSTLMPFVSQEIWDKGGICYGQNRMTKHLIIADRRKNQSPHSVYLGLTGSGKSMGYKMEMENVILGTEDDIIILDPEREAFPIVDLFKGEFVHLSAGSKMHINALDMMQYVEKGDDPVAIKCEFILTLVEMAVGKGNVSPKQQTIIDRCSHRLLTNVLNGRRKRQATLKDLYELIKKQPEDEARDLAACLELYVLGSLNMFAQPTNVDTTSRLLCYDIRDLGEKLKPLAMTIVLDAIQNRVALNRSLGKRTWVYIDEFWWMYRQEYTAKFFDAFYRRMRKYGCLICSVSQNVSSLLRSEYGRDMLSNSEFLMLYNQSDADRKELGELLDISGTQMGYITNAPAGCGLMRCGSALIPFDGRIDTETKLYRVMTTKIEEVGDFG